MKYNNGDIYEGEWREDKKDGKGKFFDKEKNNIFEGVWKDNYKHGRGKIIDKEKNLCIEGKWKNNEKRGIFFVNMSDESYYIQQYINGTLVNEFLNKKLFDIKEKKLEEMKNEKLMMKQNNDVNLEALAKIKK